MMLITGLKYGKEEGPQKRENMRANSGGPRRGVHGTAGAPLGILQKK